MPRIHRIPSPRKHPFVTVDRHQVQREDLTWEATGMLTYLASMPADWRINRADLIRRKANGGHSTRRIMQELHAHGYLRLVRSRADDGQVENHLEFYENPSRNPDAGVEQPDLPNLDIMPMQKARVAGNQPSGNRVAGNQPSGNRVAGNQPSCTEEDRHKPQRGKCAVPQPPDNPFPEGQEIREEFEAILQAWRAQRDTPPLLRPWDNAKRMWKLIDLYGGPRLAVAISRILAVRPEARTITYCIPLLETEDRWYREEKTA